jgi:CDP-diacylglycerol--glycerol-3-phosphate 3-phosphatidyltransferase
MRREFFTPSNLLSIARALLAVPFAIIMLSPIPSARLWGAGIIAAGALTDNLDGRLARKYGYETEWGRILDPLADKIGVAVVALVLLKLGDIPLWFVVALIVRDILIFLGGLAVKAKRGLVLPSNLAGKWAIGIISLALFALVVDGQSPTATVLIWASTIMLALSFGLYVRRFVETMKGVPV